MTTPDPTIIDVVRKLDAEDAPEETYDLLGAILQSHAASADHFQSMQDRWWAEARATVVAMQDGIEAAMAEREWGGTTANYERVLGMIDEAVSRAGYGPIHDWYTEQELKSESKFGDRRYPPHPAYKAASGWGAM